MQCYEQPDLQNNYRVNQCSLCEAELERRRDTRLPPNKQHIGDCAGNDRAGGTIPGRGSLQFSKPCSEDNGQHENYVQTIYHIMDDN